MEYKRSSDLFKQAQVYLPGGVNSPVRAFKNVNADPLFIKKANGAYLFDEDENQLIDYVNSWGPMLYGHAFPPVINAVIERAKMGTSFGAPTEIENQLAQLAVSIIPGVEKIRFVNSGTEACMSAIRLARGFTKRRKIIKFLGCYHGHADSFLVGAGSGLSTLGLTASGGVPQGASADTLLASYNNIESVQELFERNKNDIAAVIVEPVAGNMGCVPPDGSFLIELRRLCSEYRALLIFDEVMTGFRLARGGAQEYFGVMADIVVLGKIIGGGMPVGAFAGKKVVMDLLAPIGPVYQAGTLSGNPVAMAAGFEMLKALSEDSEIYRSLEQKGRYLEKGISSVLQKAEVDFSINRVGSMMSVFFTKEKVVDFNTAQPSANLMFSRFFNGMLKRGIYIPPSAYESWFLSDALSYPDIDRTIDAVEETMNLYS